MKVVRKDCTGVRELAGDNLDEGPVFDFPRSWWRRIRTINGLERLHREIRRRTRVVGIFPHEASALRAPRLCLQRYTRSGTGRQYLNLALEKTSGEILPYRPYRKLQKNGCLTALDLKPGQVVADLGAGTGYFTRRMARKVGETGVVYGVDIQPEMLELLGTWRSGG